MSIYHPENPTYTFEDIEDNMDVKQLDSFAYHSERPHDSFYDLIKRPC